MKKLLFLSLLLFTGLQTKLSGQLAATNFSYTVLSNQSNLASDQRLIEFSDNSVLLHDHHQLVIYDENHQISHTKSLENDEVLEAVSLFNNLVYCGVRQAENYSIKVLDLTLQDIDVKNPDFAFSDFEKTSNGYFFYNSRLKDDDESTMFFTDNNFVQIHSFFTSSPYDQNTMVGSNFRVQKKDNYSVYFNPSGTGKVYELYENGQSMLVFNMGQSQNAANDNQAVSFTALANVAKESPMLIYAISNEFLIFFSQKNGNYLYYYDRLNEHLEWKHASVNYDQMDVFNFNATQPSAFLPQRNKFGALLKGRDMQMIKEVVTPASKTNHLPDCQADDIILMTFDMTR